MDAKPGYGSGTQNARAKEFALADDVHLDPVGQAMVSSVPPPGSNNSQSATGNTHGGITVAEFEPDGTLDPGSLPGVRLANRSNDALSVSQTSDAYGYEIVRENP